MATSKAKKQASAWDDWETADLSSSESEPELDAEQQQAANAALWKQANTGLTYVLPVPGPSRNTASSSQAVTSGNTVFTPALQILKRPTSGSGSSGQTKTAEGMEQEKAEMERKWREREKGYAEARERIFGAGGDSVDAEKTAKTERVKKESGQVGGEAVRQPKGPSEDARGFGDRGRGKGRGKAG